MLPEISIYQLKNQNENEWFTCADINEKDEILCGTDQGIIYQTHSPSDQNQSTYKQLIGSKMKSSFGKKQSFFFDILGHRKLISDICYYDPHGCYILSCSADNDLRLWSSSSSTCRTIYRSHLSPIWCLAVHAKSDRFASGSMDQTVRLWTPERNHILRTFVHHTNEINTVAFHPNGKYLASGSTDGLIILWAMEQAQPARIFPSSFPVEQLTFTSDGNQLISMNSNLEQKSDQINLWDIRTAQQLELIKNIPSHRRLLKSCQIETTNKFLTGFNKSLLCFHLHTTVEETKNSSFRTELSSKSMIQRLIHLSSRQANQCIAIVE